MACETSFCIKRTRFSCLVVLATISLITQRPWLFIESSINRSNISSNTNWRWGSSKLFIRIWITWVPCRSFINKLKYIGCLQVISLPHVRQAPSRSIWFLFLDLPDRWKFRLCGYPSYRSRSRKNHRQFALRSAFFSQLSNWWEVSSRNSCHNCQPLFLATLVKFHWASIKLSEDWHFRVPFAGTCFQSNWVPTLPPRLHAGPQASVPKFVPLRRH